ncbi:hypothetical protein ANN_27287 [Periplaneta americana]|uniref:DUF4817 domain-containing protein n=1 Tax=Periplaneta americana TaxID=6978 RepID=A0ABQ8RXQ2_PERAM|nr:hypothetical protein ANN_27287 [Periplaneta americana]
MQYTLNQRLFLVKQYWITNSITATQRTYQREFGVRNPPKRNTILGLVNKLETTGSLVSEKGKHRSSRRPTVVVDTFIVQNPAILSIIWNLWPPRSPDLTTPDNICYRGFRLFSDMHSKDNDGNVTEAGNPILSQKVMFY